MAPMNVPAVMPALPDDSVESATFSVTGGRAVERLRAGQMVPWQGFIVVEGVETGDGRFVSEGALSWQNDLLPVPLMAQFENPVGGSGHDGAVLAGKIMTMTRIGSKVWATGYIDPFTPGGIRLALALDRQNMRGISVDLDSVELAEDRRSGVRNISKGRIRGATVCPFQAIVEATIELTNDEGDAMAASAGPITAKVFTLASDPVESLVASGGSSIPMEPPKSWFALPSNPNEINHPLEISADGRLSGIIASEGTCHIAFANKCEPPPKSKTKYAAFRVGSVHTAEGDSVRTGPIVMDTVHPDLRRSASDAMAFYAHTGCAVADVVPYDTQFGIYVAGVMRPDATPSQIRNLRASDISPDWRFINGNPREMCAMLAVNNGGFKVPQSLAASAGDYILPGNAAVAISKDEEMLALVASGGVRAALADCGCDEIPQTFAKGAPFKGAAPPFEGDEEDEEAVDDDEKEELTLASDFLSKFGPRRFRTPKVRVFRIEQFHANHDQSTHGRRSGRGEGVTEADQARYDKEIPDITDSYLMDDDPGNTAAARAQTRARARRLQDDIPDLSDVAYDAEPGMEDSNGPRRRNTKSSPKTRSATPGDGHPSGGAKQGGTSGSGEKIAPLGNPNASKSGYDPDKGMRVDSDGIPIVNWKTQRSRLPKDSWNLVRDDNSDLTDDNVYGPGKTYAPAPPSEPRWVYIDKSGYVDSGRIPPSDIDDFDPRK